ncbi:MAG: ATP-grasp fold amidoligase family protein [Candidatus Helarchaeota archaeon]
MKIHDFFHNPEKYLGMQARLFYWYKIIHQIAPWTFIDDKAYIKYKFLQKFGFPINLKNPKTFNEKLNWMKLYDRDPFYTKIADKYLVREYITEKVGVEYLNPLLGVYKSPEEIDWSKLPDQFVLKVNQGCKFNILCKDKHKLDIPNNIQKLRLWIKDNGYNHAREWPYKNIPPRIICEPFLEGAPEWGLLDYKFFCFNGEPIYVAVDFDRFTYHTQFFYDMHWQRQPFVQGLPTPDRDAPKPENLEEMIDIATKLSQGFPFIRVDCYNFNPKVLVGELTFHPAADFKMITPFEYELALGKMIKMKSV